MFIYLLIFHVCAAVGLMMRHNIMFAGFSWIRCDVAYKLATRDDDPIACELNLVGLIIGWGNVLGNVISRKWRWICLSWFPSNWKWHFRDEFIHHRNNHLARKLTRKTQRASNKSFKFRIYGRHQPSTHSALSSSTHAKAIASSPTRFIAMHKSDTITIIQNISSQFIIRWQNIRDECDFGCGCKGIRTEFGVWSLAIASNASLVNETMHWQNRNIALLCRWFGVCCRHNAAILQFRDVGRTIRIATFGLHSNEEHIFMLGDAIDGTIAMKIMYIQE